jgi:hypothetical protein
VTRAGDGPAEFDLSAAMAPSPVVVHGGGAVPVPRGRRAPYAEWSTTDVLMELIAYGGAAPAGVVFELGRRVERGDIRDTAAPNGVVGDLAGGAGGAS